MRKLYLIHYLYQLLSDRVSEGDVDYSGTAPNRFYFEFNSGLGTITAVLPAK